ncbi:MAG: ComF family protein [Pseudomonadales bacterium]
MSHSYRRLQPLPPGAGARQSARMRPHRIQYLLQHLLPGRCLLCDTPLPPASAVDLCEYCLAALPWNIAACPRCGEPERHAASAPEPCRRCREQPPPFDLTVAPLRYEASPRQWVGRLKDHLGMVEGLLLGMLLADAAAERYADPALTRPTALLPVPLTWHRLARRGHNQALALAVPVARRLEVPVWRRAAVRRRQGPKQRGLSRVGRMQNPMGAFACRRRWNEPGPCLGIVDDVMTTGTTAAELTRVLLEAGAGAVHVLCATRTPPPAGPEVPVREPGSTGDAAPTHRYDR